MILYIYNPSTGRILYKERMKYRNKFQADTFANEYAARINRKIFPSPDHNGDLRVEFRMRLNIPSWPKAKSYYFIAKWLTDPPPLPTNPTKWALQIQLPNGHWQTLSINDKPVPLPVSPFKHRLIEQKPPRRVR